MTKFLCYGMIMSKKIIMTWRNTLKYGGINANNNKTEKIKKKLDE